MIALRISVAAASLISSDACSLYQAVWGVQIRLGASFRGPKEKLMDSEGKKQEKQSDKKTQAGSSVAAQQIKQIAPKYKICFQVNLKVKFDYARCLPIFLFCLEKKQKVHSPATASRFG